MKSESSDSIEDPAADRETIVANTNKMLISERIIRRLETEMADDDSKIFYIDEEED